MEHDYFDDKIEELSRYMVYFIDTLAFSYESHCRIITDVKIPFPKNYILVGYNDCLELSNVRYTDKEGRGWGKPDKMLGGGIELRYLWKNFKPKTFEVWQRQLKN